MHRIAKEDKVILQGPTSHICSSALLVLKSQHLKCVVVLLWPQRAV